MQPEELIRQATSEYSLDDVRNDTVETVSVLAVEELASLIERAVAERTRDLRQELEAARQQLSSFAGDGLEAEAAEAALEAEARALEAKAEAEQRAAQAESRARQLEDELLIAKEEASGADPEAEQKLADLEAAKAQLEQELAAAQAAAADTSQLDELQAEKETLAAQVKDLEDQLALAKEAAEGAEELEEAAEPVTESDLRHARRLAEAFLEEVFMDDEEKSNKAIADDAVEQVLEKELGAAYKQFVKRVKPAVRAEGSAWEDTLAAMKKRSW